MFSISSVVSGVVIGVRGVEFTVDLSEQGDGAPPARSSSSSPLLRALVRWLQLTIRVQTPAGLVPPPPLPPLPIEP